MHGLCVAVANCVCFAVLVQLIFQNHLFHLSPCAPRKFLLTELDLLPLQRLWPKFAVLERLAALPFVFLLHMVQLDNLNVAFGASCSMASSLAEYL